jgi:tryptophanase
MEHTNRIRVGRQNVLQPLVAKQLVQLAQSSRVYTQSHLDYVIEAISEFVAERKTIRGLRITDAPQVLRHFTAKFEEV